MSGYLSIYYDGKDAFYPQATPFVSLEYPSVYYGELWTKKEDVTLRGVITGCTNEKILEAKSGILTNFSKNYQSLEIHQIENTGNTVVFTKDLVEIQSINFSNGSWIGVLPYTIQISSYPSGYFSGAFGILDPSDTWNYNENQDRSATITHTISCRGINTSSAANNALYNASNWALLKRNSGDAPSSAFIEYLSPDRFFLVNSNEVINRYNGTYSIIDTYSIDLTQPNYGVVRYSATINSGNNVITVDLRGKVQGGYTEISGTPSLDQARSSFQAFSPLGAAAFLYFETFGLGDLNPIPLEYSVEEDAYNASISFNYTFDNNNNPDVYFDYTVGLKSGNFITASINGDIIARGGDALSKFKRASEYAKTINPYDLVSNYYSKLYPNWKDYPLNPIPASSGMVLNVEKGAVSINAEFIDQKIAGKNFYYFDYVLEFSPPVIGIDIKPTYRNAHYPDNISKDSFFQGFQGEYSIVDLQYITRSSLSIRGNAKINNTASSLGESAFQTYIDNTLQDIKKYIMIIVNGYIPQGVANQLTLDKNDMSLDRYDKLLVSFEFGWSFISDHGPIVVTNNTNNQNTTPMITIVNLKV